MAGRKFTVNADGTVSPSVAPHLVLGAMTAMKGTEAVDARVLCADPNDTWRSTSRRRAGRS